MCENSKKYNITTIISVSVVKTVKNVILQQCVVKTVKNMYDFKKGQ